MNVKDIVTVIKTPPYTTINTGTVSYISKITENGYYVACGGYLFDKEELRLATNEEIKEELIRYLRIYNS